MKVLVTTESGTEYTFDPEAMTWERKGKTLRWTDRSEGPTEGELYEFPEIYIGYPMCLYIMDPDNGPDAVAPILTTAVRNFENLED